MKVHVLSNRIQYNDARDGGHDIKQYYGDADSVERPDSLCCHFLQLCHIPIRNNCTQSGDYYIASRASSTYQ
jgi:hypothetical protein